jgi:DNA-binding NarL/FixJ family response regulator
MITVLVADDQPLVRGGIAMLLTGQPDISVVAEAGTGHEAIALAERHQPDVVVMDLKMPDLDGVTATQTLTAEGRDPDRLVKVLILTTFNDDESVYAALRSGASGFLLKDTAPARLVEAVRTVAAGRSWIDPDVGAQVIRALTSEPSLGAPTSQRVARLTPREREVLVLMARGLSNTEISARFVLSEATVRTHVARILMKTGSRDRSQAVVLAYQSDLVRPTSR